jgi:hypothetical protein
MNPKPLCRNRHFGFQPKRKDKTYDNKMESEAEAAKTIARAGRSQVPPLHGIVSGHEYRAVRQILRELLAVAEK